MQETLVVAERPIASSMKPYALMFFLFSLAVGLFFFYTSAVVLPPSSSPSTSAAATIRGYDLHGDAAAAGDMAAAAASVRSVLCFGDSLTAGFHNGGHTFAPYGNVLAKKLPSLNIETVGYSGWTTRQMLDNADNPEGLDAVDRTWPGINLKFNERIYDLVIVMAGTNDIGLGRDSKARIKSYFVSYGRIIGIIFMSVV